MLCNSTPPLLPIGVAAAGHRPSNHPAYGSHGTTRRSSLTSVSCCSVDSTAVLSLTPGSRGLLQLWTVQPHNQHVARAGTKSMMNAPGGENWTARASPWYEPHQRQCLQLGQHPH